MDPIGQPIILLSLLKNVLINFKNSEARPEPEIWYLEKGIKPTKPVKKSLEEDQSSDEAISGQEAVRMTRSENRFLQIQGLDNHLAHMSRPRLENWNWSRLKLVLATANKTWKSY